MAERLRRRQDDDCAARLADPSLRNHRDRKRELALQAPRLSRCTAPACPGGQTGTSRAALRRTRGGHSAPRGSLLFATGTSLNLRPSGVTIGRRSGVKLQRRLTVRESGLIKDRIVLHPKDEQPSPWTLLAEACKTLTEMTEEWRRYA